MDESNPLNIPQLKQLPGRNIKIHYFIVADQAFPLKPYIMRPYPSRNLDKKKRIFNYRLSRARTNVENAFGILSSKFQFLKKLLHFKPAQVDLFVRTACCLHIYRLVDQAMHKNLLLPTNPYFLRILFYLIFLHLDLYSFFFFQVF